MRRIILLTALALSACASPEPDYYTLSEMDGNVLQSLPPRSIKVRRPGIPAYLNRPDMVSASGVELRKSSGKLWAEPLDTMLERVLALDMAQRLPNSTVFTESGHASISQEYTVDVEILRFDADSGGKSVLQAQAGLRDSRSAVFIPLPPVTLEGAAASAGEPAAHAMSALTGQLADILIKAVEAASVPENP